MDIKKYLEERIKIVDGALDRFLPPEDTYPQVIHKSMRYSIFAGGKRLRPILAMAGADLFDKELKEYLPAACALEMVHTYSLIHDDLPAMDDDDYRRGKLTNHKVFGEDIAILAGDALLTLAFEILSREESLVDPAINMRVMGELAGAAGVGGMIGGQVVDLESEGKAVEGDTLSYIHTHKTGALLRASVRIGGIISRANDREMEALTRYAEALGLAFQIVDDILDIEGEEEKMGKRKGMDSIQKKATYPSLYGLTAAREKAQELYDESLSSIEIFGGRGNLLQLIAKFLVNRDY
ncbi:MAG: polyprenyl synthetase family protein [Candidatus Syntrophonatronum acetioxidans]|uniref:Farnesyl diphosphate synthase n=1 Tax=Candidatus Syntrophonatronum acetioxidans TaxID=1795816 RepID=A0A424YFA2_9FIRM|nr:MAG: polyprenyl synthetase family protein [Candidatus Syntrophonatronum acetioxidans]